MLALPFDAKLAELNSVSSGILSEESGVDLCKKLNTYLDTLLAIENVYNVYRLRQLFEFRHSDYMNNLPNEGLKEEPESKASEINPNESIGETSIEVQKKTSVVSDYFQSE